MKRNDKSILILSECKDFAENEQANYLVSIIRKAGWDCIHIGLLTASLPEDYMEIPDVIILFYNWYNKSWNQTICDQVLNTFGDIPFLFLTDSIVGYDKKLKRKYPVYALISSVFDVNWDSLLQDLFDGRLSKVEDYRFDCWDFFQSEFQNRDDLIRKNIKHALVATSFNCDKKCTFCQYANTHIHVRNIDDVLTEIEMLKNKCHVRGLHFNDTLFAAGQTGKSRVLKLAKVLFDNDIQLPYSCTFTPNFVFKLNLKEIRLLLQSGLYRVYLGIESLNYDDLKLYGKPYSSDEAMKAIQLWKSFDIDIVVNFINFNPYTNFKTLSSNLERLYSANVLRLSLFCTEYVPLPNTSLYDRILKDKLLLKNDDVIDYYEYKSQDVGHLQRFLKQFYRELTEQGYLEYMEEYELVFYTLSIARMIGDHQTYAHLKKYSESIQGHFSNLQMNVYQLVRRLINLLQGSWSEEKAYDIAGQYKKLLLQNREKLLNSVLYRLHESGSRYVDTYLEYL